VSWLDHYAGTKDATPQDEKEQLAIQNIKAGDASGHSQEM
jgi:hypothetical protein